MEFGGHQRAGPQMAYESNFFLLHPAQVTFLVPQASSFFPQTSVIQGPWFYTGLEVLESEQAAVQHC